MDYIGTIVKLADTALSLWADVRKDRYQKTLLELKKRYDKEQAKDKPDHNMLDSVERDILYVVGILSIEAKRSPTDTLPQ
tara:strand:+ start:726 stop:965 length:240 start_codon:yes stop_codon:yes gene_type:complete